MRSTIQHCPLSAGDGSPTGSSAASYSSHSSRGISVSVSPMSTISNQFFSSDTTPGTTVNVVIQCVHASYSPSLDLLWQILKEVQASTSRIATLEKKHEQLQEGMHGSCFGKKKIIEPSPEVRVTTQTHSNVTVLYTCNDSFLCFE